MWIGCQKISILLLSFGIIWTVLQLKRVFPKSTGIPDVLKCPFIPATIPKSYDPNHGRLDRSRKFKTHMFAVVGHEWNLAPSSVCLATQLSLDRLGQVPDLLSSWEGPVSFSLLLPNPDISILVEFFQYLTVCHGNIAAKSAFHVSYPNHEKISNTPSDTPAKPQNINCIDSSAFLKNLLKRNEIQRKGKIHQEDFRYPQNLLRNVAKQGCPTNYTILSDVDMVPGYPKMFSDLEQFISSRPNCEKCVYVLPVYEISNKSRSLPNGKDELRSLIRKRLARRFLWKMVKANQNASDLSRWEKIPLQPKLDVAFSVKKYEFKYEPIYLADSRTPDYEERFVGYGKTRVSQVYEMALAGYNFSVLNNAFFSHWGFTEGKRSKARLQQYKENDQRFQTYVKEVSARYKGYTHIPMDMTKFVEEELTET